MKALCLITALLAPAAFSPLAAQEQTPGAQAQSSAVKTLEFTMTVSAGARGCLPKAYASVTDTSAGNVEILQVVAHELPPNTDFDFFIIQVPNAPFGASWYQGDISTDSKGTGVGHFIGRFSRETFIISPNLAPAPNVFPSPPAVVPEATGGVKTNPVQMYHLGLWFNSAGAAKKAGCPGAATPFNGEHDAGIQVLNTATFPDLQGPLIGIQ